MPPIVDNSSFNNTWYQPGRSKAILLLWFLINALFFQNPANPWSGLKIWLLRLFGARIGKGVVIKPSVNIKYPWRLEIGDYSWIGEDVWIDNLADIRLGANVCLSQGAFLLTGNHDYRSAAFDLKIGNIVLEDGVWIGAKAVVCPGVTCFSHAVLTVNSVATANLEAYGVYQGNPAQKIRDRIIT